MNKIWLNNQLVSESKATVSVFDRGFLYGDGVYETVRVYDGRIFRIKNHLERLDHSLKGINLKIPWNREYLIGACERLIKANKLKESLVRITISRGVGKIGYDPSACKKPTLVIFSTPVRQDLFDLWKNGVKIQIVQVRRNSLKSLSPSVKHTNCLNGILAKMESLKARSFEGVFLNLDDELAEGTISNIFIVKEGVLKTPSLDCGILDGVTRGAMIETAKKTGIKVSETHIRLPEVFKADEIFLTSTTMEAMPVVRVNGKIVGNGKPGMITRLLHKNLRILLEKELRLNLEPLPPI